MFPLPHRVRRIACVAFAVVLSSALPALADDPNYTHHGDVIYWRKYGMALTMEIFQPS